MKDAQALLLAISIVFGASGFVLALVALKVCGHLIDDVKELQRKVK